MHGYPHAEELLRGCVADRFEVAGRGTSQMKKKTRDLRELLSRMDDYVVAPEEEHWLSTPLEAFAGRTPQELIADGRIRDLVIEFDRLRDGQPV